MEEEGIVKGKLQGIAKKVDAELPEGFGFVVLAFKFNEKGQLMYVSNADRAKEILAEVINAYKTVARVEGKEKGQPKFYNVPKVYFMPEK